MKISKLKPIFAKTQAIFLQKLKQFFQNSIFRKIRAPSIAASLINSSFVMQPFICTFSEWIWVWSAGSASVIFSTSQRVCTSSRPRYPMNFQRKLKQSSETLHVFKIQQYSLKTQRLFPENSRKFDQNSIFPILKNPMLPEKQPKKTTLQVQLWSMSLGSRRDKEHDRDSVPQ